MIRNALNFLKGEVNKFMNLQSGASPLDQSVLLSNIVNSDESKAMGLPNNKLVLSLICIEEERQLKSQDHYNRTSNGTIYSTNPELRFNLFVMFAAHFDHDHYGEGLKALSLILRFFQGNSVFDAKQYPSLGDDLKRLIVDLHTQPMEQQSQLWQAMGGKFLPSVMYKVRLLTIDEGVSGVETAPISDIQR